MTATRTSTDSADSGVRPARPRIGLLGIMQSLYDDMVPGIVERQAAYARSVGRGAERRRGRRRRAAVQGARPDRGGDEVARGGGAGRPPGRDAHLRAGDARRPRPAGHAAADLPGEHPAGAERDRRVGHGGPDVQPGHPRRAGHGERDGPRGPAVPRDHRRLAVRVVRRVRRRVGARGGGGHALAAAQGGGVRLRDERDGRHPRRRARADPVAGPADRPPAPGDLVRAVGGGLRRGRRRPDRLGGRALRDRPRAVGPGARGPRADAARASSRSSARAATARTPPTSTRSARTGGSTGCRWPRRRR